MVDLDKTKLQAMDLFRDLINKRLSEFCLIDQNYEEVHNLKSPDEEEKNICSTISIGREIRCLSYVGVFFYNFFIGLKVVLSSYDI